MKVKGRTLSLIIILKEVKIKSQNILGSWQRRRIELAHPMRRMCNEFFNFEMISLKLERKKRKMKLLSTHVKRDENIGNLQSLKSS